MGSISAVEPDELEPKPGQEPEKPRPSLKEWALDKGRTTWADVAKWKRVMLAVSAGMVVVGLIVALFEPGGAEDPLMARQGGPQNPGAALVPGGTELVPGGVPTPEGETQETGGTVWSPAFLKMGFGFFVGFAIGFTLRTFLKLALFACGLMFLAMFWMSSAELITVEWERIGALFGGWFERVGEEITGLQSMITGSLPATGLGAFGLYAGLRKR